LTATPVLELNLPKLKISKTIPSATGEAQMKSGVFNGQEKTAAPERKNTVLASKRRQRVERKNVIKTSIWQ